MDGTLLDSKKRVTSRAAAAIEKLAGAGIGFAITSDRPPRGLRAIAEKVKVTAPIAAFNGGTLVRPDTFEVIESLTLLRDVAERVIARLGQLGLNIWVYAGLEWYLRDPDAPHRAQGESNVQFAPTVVAEFSAALAVGVAKIVGVSDDLDLVARVEKTAQEEFAGAGPSQQAQVGVRSVTAERSQPFYLDVTHPDANKGRVVEMLARTQNIPTQKIATIGDMPNDVLMFVKSGFPIAMGQASDQVKSFASCVTTSLDDEGFARASRTLFSARPSPVYLPHFFTRSASVTAGGVCGQPSG